MRATLYRLHDRGGRLLYVGISLSVLQRLTNHSSTKPWWDEVAAIRLEHFPTRDDALRAEASAILLEHPRYNIQEPRGRWIDKPFVAYMMWQEGSPVTEIAMELGCSESEVRRFIDDVIWRIHSDDLPPDPDG